MIKSLFVVLCFLLFVVFRPAYGQPVRIAYLQSDIHQLPCWVALEKGLYEREGVKVEVAGIFKAGPELMSAFTAGALDVGYVGVAPANTAVANKVAHVVVLAQVNTEGSAVVVKRQGKIQAVSDLVGRSVAIPGHATVQDSLLRKALIQARVQPEQVKIMVLKPPEMIEALRTDQIDAFIAWEPYPAKALTMGIGRVIAESRNVWKDHPCCVLAVDERFLNTQPGKAKAVVRAHMNAIDFIGQNREEAVSIGVKYTGMDRASIERAMEKVRYTPVLSLEGEREYVEFLKTSKYIKVEDVQAFVNQFMRIDFLKEAVRK